MDLMKIIPIALALGMDAMSVSMAVGVRWGGWKQRLRLASHMGLFQFLAPILGWAVGKQLAELLRGFGCVLSGLLLLGIGLKMLYEAVKSAPGSLEQRGGDAVAHALHLRKRDPTRGWSLLALSIATSIDALVVGFSFGLRDRQQIWFASLVIGIVAAGMSFVGAGMGKHAGKTFGRAAEILGSLVLIALGVTFLCM